MERRCKGEYRGTVGKLPGDVGGEMLDVCEGEHARTLWYVEVCAVRGQRAGNGSHGVAMLLEILAAVEKREGKARIGGFVALSAHGAGKNPTRDEIARATHEKLRRGADEPRHRKGPAGRVPLGEIEQQVAGVEYAVDLGDDVAGEHHLVEFASGDAADGLGDGALPLDGAARALRPPHPRWSIGDRYRGQRPARVLAEVDGRDPRLAAAPADDDLGDDDDRGAGLRVEREGCECDRARAGNGNGVVDRCGGAPLGPPALHPAESLRAADLELCGNSPADEALAPAHPGEGSAGGEAGEQGLRIGDGPGANGDRRRSLWVTECIRIRHEPKRRAFDGSRHFEVAGHSRRGRWGARGARMWP
ncbi:unannotated protein [freshwater metagenome]|uniref:Unannotated protein n=1 Tax=freshwater metagenome TaxID=449393 RepID=A0A6J7MBB4_9ZZZZ